MNSTILKNIFREFAPRLTGLTAAGGGLYGLAKWYDAANEKNLQSPASPESQPRSRIMQAIVDANPNRNKLDARTDPQAEREQVAKLIKNTPFSKGTPESLKDPSKLESFRALDKNLGAATKPLNSPIPPYVVEGSIKSWLDLDRPAGGMQLNISSDDSKRLDELAGVGSTNSVTTSKNTPSSPNVIPNNPTNTNAPKASQQPGTAASNPNASVDDKTSNNQNVFNSIAASLNNNPGYLMPTAIGQTIIAALLGRLLGGKTGMGLGAIMGLLASPLTASYLARNNYLPDIAKPFSETEKGWFNPNKSE